MEERNSGKTQALLVLSAVSILFVVFRGDILGYTSLAYLIWNLLLAWIPYLIAVYIIKPDTRFALFVPLFILWLIFFPNAPYLVTDIIHVASPTPHVLWYDSLTFFIFGLTGLFLGVISLSRIHDYFKAHMSSLFAETAVFFLCIAASFGIYLGRFERWNTWDLFVHPSEIVRHSYEISKNFAYPGTPLIFMSVLSLFIYATYKILGRLMALK